MNPVKKLFLNEVFILVLISLNALLIFIQAFPATGFEREFAIADDVVSVLFVLELAIKMSHFGVRGYFESHWNKFDFFLVLVSLPSIITHFLPEGSTQMVNLSMLLALRVFRVFKFFRFIKFFPRVEHIFNSAKQAVAASGMVLAGFFVFIFIASLLCCYLLRDIAPTSFGNPVTAYYSTFQVFTVEGWNGIPAKVEAESAELQKVAAAKVAELKAAGAPQADIDKAEAKGKAAYISSTAVFFMRILFITLFIIGGVFGLSIVNSIFVDAMVSNSNDGMEDDIVKMQDEFEQLRQKVIRLTALLRSQQQQNQEQPPQADDTDDSSQA